MAEPKLSPDAPRRSPNGAFLRRRTPADTYNDIIFVFFVLALAWAPLFFGSNRPLAWAVNAVLFGALLILFEAGRLVSGAPHPVSWRRIWWCGALFALFVVWILFQIVPWAPAAWQNPFWDLARQALAGFSAAPRMEGAISASPDDGLVALIRLAPNAVSFYLGLQLCRDRRRAEIFAFALVGLITLYACYGIVQLLFFPQELLWAPKRSYLDAVTSTFVNRNSFATFAAVGLIVTLGLMLESFRRQDGGRAVPLAHRIATLTDQIVRRALPLTIPALIIGVALLWSLSRAGMMSGLLGVLALLVLFVCFERRRGGLLAVSGLVLIALVAILLTYGGGVAERLEAAGQEGVEDMSARLTAPTSTFTAALDQPLFGFGYGSFPKIFPQYRADPYIFAFWNHAHNTYAEIIMDVGFPAAAIVGLLMVVLLISIFRNVTRCERRPMLSLVALAASVTVLIHSMVDFSLQIQAVALIYWGLLGAGLAQSWSRRIETAQS
ncbi:O-antigen ligase family protein [Ancylobacter radicis]|uniref:O-antigen ligase family protein n=1 Tax=Ancylobacter radicis TaxID=2836179 RepID=A0ABS5R2K2_9HYPH|nr:O-antigen ligase family protein [Ancylobacter radicis]